MTSITNIKQGYKNLSFDLVQRYTNAKDTYNLMRKLNTEQETSGEFDNLLYKIEEDLKGHKLYLNISYQIFEGYEDIIFELSVDITMNDSCKLDNKDLVKEHILGSILLQIKNHFNFYYHSHSSDIDTIKKYFRGY